MSNKRKQQEEILRSSKRQLQDIKNIRNELVRDLAEKNLSVRIAEAMMAKTNELKKKIEEISIANTNYARQMYEDN